MTLLADNGNAQNVELLLETGGSERYGAKADDTQGEAVLMQAVAGGHMEILTSIKNSG